MMGGDVVVTFSFNAFTRDELLAKHLVGCAVLGSMAPVMVSISSLSLRTLYWFFDSNTGWLVIWEVAKSGRPSSGRQVRTSI